MHPIATYLDSLAKGTVTPDALPLPPSLLGEQAFLWQAACNATAEDFGSVPVALGKQGRVLKMRKDKSAKSALGALAFTTQGPGTICEVGSDVCKLERRDCGGRRERMSELM